MARFFESITLTNFLSFGPEPTTLDLEDVNVLVGANGSGKSNLIEAINLLRHAPGDVARVLREGGGVREWLWKDENDRPAASATLEVTLAAGVIAAPAMHYRLSFTSTGDRLTILDERLENAERSPGHSKPYFYFGYENGHPMMNAADGNPRYLRRENVDVEASILAQRKDPDTYPEVTGFGERLGQIRAYCHWNTGPGSPARENCRADVRKDRLEENLSNLPARIATLKRDPQFKAAFREKLGAVAPKFDDIEIIPEGSSLQLVLQSGGRTFSSHRLSDGTLRYLMLLTILLDPTPPPLIVIEEPELSLHLDVLPTLRKLILDASRHTQIILTTQSPTFLDAWTDHPEVVVVCERQHDSTTLERLDPDDYPDTSRGLGDRWIRGEIGGTRW